MRGLRPKDGTLRIEFRPGEPDSAWCMVDGRRFNARCGNGAVPQLCRTLRDAGIPDQPYAAFDSKWRTDIPAFTGPSIYALGRWTYEYAGNGIKQRRWKAPRTGVEAPTGRVGALGAERGHRNPQCLPRGRKSRLSRMGATMNKPILDAANPMTAEFSAREERETNERTKT